MSLPPLTVPTVPFCAPSQACKPQAECHRELPAGQASFGEVAQSGQGPGRHAAVSRLGCWHLGVQGQPVALWLVLCGPGGGGSGGRNPGLWDLRHKQETQDWKWVCRLTGPWVSPGYCPVSLQAHDLYCICCHPRCASHSAPSPYIFTKFQQTRYRSHLTDGKTEV